MAVTHNDSLRQFMAASIVAAVDVGTVNPTGRVVFFDSLSNQVAVCLLSKPAFQYPVNGIATCNATLQDNSPVVGATPIRFEVQDCNGNWIWRGSCGVGQDLGTIGTPIPPSVPVRLDNFFYRATF